MSFVTSVDGITLFIDLIGQVSRDVVGRLFSQSGAKVSAGFTNVTGLVVTAFDLLLLPVCPPVCLCP